MGRCIPLELRSSFSLASACVLACPLKQGGFYISRQQLLRAKRSMNVPSWSSVNLLPQDHCKELIVIADHPENDEVIKCAN